MPPDATALNVGFGKVHNAGMWDLRFQPRLLLVRLSVVTIQRFFAEEFGAPLRGGSLWLQLQGAFQRTRLVQIFTHAWFGAQEPAERKADFGGSSCTFALGGTATGGGKL